MGPTVLSSYSKFLRAVIVGGVLFFFAMGVMSLWLACSDAPNSSAVAILLAMAVGFGGMGWFGLRLLPFVHASCAATPEGLYIFDRQHNETFLPWGSVSRVKDWQNLQVVDIYDQQGKRVLSIDYYISNFVPFYAQLLESTSASA
ncbi:MAG: hypothetical protein EOO16_12470 [Chitinophagaceae bacterium]|nr:MAG: hypothetical protein EOO16_12470 [Chitinophagaceae bacterium]